MSVRSLLVTLVLVASACSASASGEAPQPTVVGPSAGPSEVPTETSSISATLSTTSASTSNVDGQPPISPLPLVEGELVELVPEIIATIPHPTDAYTQGLEIRDGVFYESTGQYGESRVRTFDLRGNEQSSIVIDAGQFGEGLTLVDDQIIQITWREGVANVWDAESLEAIDTFAYEGEGWGICLQSDRLIMSDGSGTLTFRDPATFEETGVVEVTLDGQAVTRLNELECVGEHVVANVWQTSTILIIDPADGAVVGLVDASNLETNLSSTVGIDVLNGIAVDPGTNAIYLTGKYWPEIFEVRLVRASASR